MATPGFTPVDETQGFAPINDTPTPKTYTPKPGETSMGATEPSAWDRVRRALPIVDRVETGLQQAGASLGMRPSTGTALAKPLPGMSDDRAIAPEQAMTSAERQAHPIATGAGEFAGGMTTPENVLLTGMTAGPAPKLIGQALGTTFAAQVLKGAYDQYQPLRDAADRKDWGEVERLGTHMVLGATLGLLGVRRTVRGESPYEELSQSGREFQKVKQANQSKEAIEKNGVGLYNKVRDTIVTHQAKLEQQASDALQPIVDRDKTQAPAISTAGAIGESAKAIAKTGYTPKPAEAKLLQKMQGISGADQYAQGRGYKSSAEARADIESQAPGRGIWDQELKQQGLTDDPASHLSLEDAKLLRTAVGRVAFGRNAAPESKAVFSAAYDQLTSAMKDRVAELDPSAGPKRFDFYNNRHRMAFELNKGVAGDMQPDLRAQDANASIAPLKGFSSGNIKEIQSQMRKTGSPDLADQLGKSQKDATALTSAHDAVNGKFGAGVYRMLQNHPKEAWPGLATMFGAHAVGLPFPLPQIAGAGAAAWNVGRIARNTSGEIGGRLQSELSPEKFNTRTTPMDADFGGGGSTGSPQPSPNSPPPNVDTRAYREAAKQTGKPYGSETATRAQDIKDDLTADPNQVKERSTTNVDPRSEKAEQIRMILQNKQAKIDNAQSAGARSLAVADKVKFENEQAGTKVREKKAQDIENIRTKKMERAR